MPYRTQDFLDVLEVEENNQGTLYGRLARAVLQDQSWPLSNAIATQQAYLASHVGAGLIRFTTSKERAYDSATLQTALGELYLRAGGDNLEYTRRVNGVASSNLLAYWTQADLAGTVAADSSMNSRTGVYTGVTLGQTGIGDGRTSASYDGSTSFCNVFSTSLQSAFNSQEGTLCAWFKMSGAGVWTDGQFRELFRLRVDANNAALLEKTSTNNQIRGLYAAGGVTKSVVDTSLAGTTNWFHFAATWSKSADQLKVYVNGSQVGTTQTGLGVWSGSLSATSTILGAGDTTPTFLHSGFIAHAACWSTPLSAAQVASLASAP